MRCLEGHPCPAPYNALLNFIKIGPPTEYSQASLKDHTLERPRAPFQGLQGTTFDYLLTMFLRNLITSQIRRTAVCESQITALALYALACRRSSLHRSLPFSQHRGHIELLHACRHRYRLLLKDERARLRSCVNRIALLQTALTTRSQFPSARLFLSATDLRLVCRQRAHEVLQCLQCPEVPHASLAKEADPALMRNFRTLCMYLENIKK